MADKKIDFKDDKIRHEVCQQVDAWYWAYYNKIKLRGSDFQLKGHIYQVDCLRETYRRESYKKAAQLGFTEIQVLKTLHGLIYRGYPQGVLYLFPTRDDVTDFSKGRFNPLIAENPAIGKHVRDTDAANIKQIGKSMLYLRGAKESQKIEGSKATSSQLKSVPVDKLVEDECDEMSVAMRALAIERLSHSEIQEHVSISTPTIPDYGIDKDYNNSDQRIWMIKCQKCGKETCLEKEFPDCLLETANGDVIRICRHCKNEISPDWGRWVAQYPERTKDHVGRSISQLNSVYIPPKKILSMFLNPSEHNTTLAEVYNSKLGMAYIAAENQLTKNQIYACCGKDAMSGWSERSTAMGVDIGKMLHVVIGHKIDNKRFRILKVARVSDFNDVHDLAKRFNTKIIVMDMEPETRKARDFQESHSMDYKVFLCDYQERLKSHEKRDEQQGLLTVRRTETCDMTHNAVTQQLIELPRRNLEIEEYAEEMTKIAKVLQEDDFTKSRTYKYRGLGADHYFHSTNYFLLACRDYAIENDFDLQHNVKQEERENAYDPFEYV